MHVALTPDLERFVNDSVERMGGTKLPDQVVHEPLQMLQMVTSMSSRMCGPVSGQWETRFPSRTPGGTRQRTRGRR